MVNYKILCHALSESLYALADDGVLGLENVATLHSRKEIFPTRALSFFQIFLDMMDRMNLTLFAKKKKGEICNYSAN